MSLAFDRNERISIDGHVWKVERRIPDGHCLVNERNGRVKALSDKKLLKHWTEGRLERCGRVKARGTSGDTSKALAASAENRKTALQRQDVLAQLRTMYGPAPYSNKTLLAFITLWKAGHQAPTAISLSSLRRWLAASRANGVVLPQEKKPAPRLSPEVEAIIEEAVDKNFMRPIPESIEDLVKIIEQELARRNAPLLAECSPSSLLLQTPSRATIYRRVRSINDEDRIKTQKGPRAAELSYGMHQGAPIEVVPMGVVEIDHTPIDVIVTDEQGIVLGRPTLTVAICRATRMCVGFCLSWEHPGFSPVMHTLRHMIAPKPSMKQLFKSGFVKNDWPCHGLPLVIVVDNAAEFHSDNFKIACASLGNIHIVYCPPKTPRMKGKVERFIRTSNNRVFHRLPGTTFGRIDKSSDYNASKCAKCTLQEINILLHKFFVDIHPYKYHRGLKQRPIDAWNSAVQKYPLRLPDHLRDLDVLAAGHDKRRLRQTGIEFLGFFYKATELKELRIRARGSPLVQIRYDASDVGTIHVLDEQAGTFVKAHCTAREVHGRSLWQAKILLKTLRLRKENADDEGLRNSEEALRARIAESASKKTNRYKGKNRHARFASKAGSPTELAQQQALSLINVGDNMPDVVEYFDGQCEIAVDQWPSLPDADRTIADIAKESIASDSMLAEIEPVIEEYYETHQPEDLDSYAKKYNLEG